MLKMIISGCNGAMGRTVARLAAADAGIEVVAGFDLSAVKTDSFPVYADPMEFGGQADVAVDFSNPSALEGLLRYCAAKKRPLVLCTTGHSAEQLSAIREVSVKIPVFRSGNMSVGINLTADLVRRACAFLGDGFDVEIVERHHRRKVDAPSGTALMLADAAKSALPYDAGYVFERQSVRQPRGKTEIGISSVRGGTIVGEHEVIFAGLDEVIEIKHTAYSRDVFAVGAVRAAKFLAAVKKPGMYDMSDLLNF
ncbi:dihydrodipicolinate reductase [Sporobacter termitidis DSM 10068]|uniref:4-hydroxy-tetrahydrodipicolinate reductase n=1 Tax=Sporobacter termitidis DSM 10068 TaxID=1123282 RepID=A0A1M5TEQ4_9FIRM|nr:4-hydroxy-tetrahydrodipicolinate reductase [Sporobacter termitidis]SHH49212.1 dihydrodipicolinate reductase [Sporobacter termitidis DSM 10068]